MRLGGGSIINAILPGLLFWDVHVGVLSGSVAFLVRTHVFWISHFGFAACFYDTYVFAGLFCCFGIKVLRVVMYVGSLGLAFTVSKFIWRCRRTYMRLL